MPIVQIDWERIKGKLGDVTAIYALTHRQASLLSSLAEQLTWSKTFQVNDYDWSDKDALDADIADLESNLQMPVNLVDIIGYIDEIEDLLRALQSITGCCDGEDITDGDQFTVLIEDGTGDVPANIVGAGYAEDEEDWAGFDDYKCMISHIMVDQLELRLRKLATLVDEAGDVLGGAAAIVAVIVSLFTTILTGGISVMALGILGSVGVSAILWRVITDATNLSDLADEIAAVHDTLACAIYAGDGTNDAIVNLKDAIDSEIEEPGATIVKNLNIDATLKALYSGGYADQNIAQIMVDTGYDPGDFVCVCDDQIGEYLNYTSFPDSSNWQSWQNYSATLNSNGITTYSARLRYGNEIGWIDMSMGDLATLVGIPSNPSNRHYYINKITFWYYRESGLTGPVYLRARTTSGSGWVDYHDGTATAVWTQYIKDWDPVQKDLQYTGSIRIGPDGTGSANFIRIDNITIDFDSALV